MSNAHTHTCYCVQDVPTVRFFDRKGFYTVHGDNALFIARTFYKVGNLR